MNKLHFIPEENIRAMTCIAFEHWKAFIKRQFSYIDIQHVGSTSIPGSLTKGDLDIQVRVEQKDFISVRDFLHDNFDQNVGSPYTDSFASFKEDDAIPPLGIQLTVIDSELDLFTKFRDKLVDNPALLRSYNELKKRHEGESIEKYRQAKSGFITSVLTYQ